MFQLSEIKLLLNILV